MAAVEPAIVTILENDAPLVAVMGTRLTLNELPQNPTYPAVTYSLSDQQAAITHDQAVGPEEATIQVSAWSKSYKQARELADLIVDALLGYSGTVGSIQVQGIFLINIVPMYDPDETLKVWQVACLFSCHFKW